MSNSYAGNKNNNNNRMRPRKYYAPQSAPAATATAISSKASDDHAGPVVKMCSEEEYNMRVKNNLVHTLEKRIVNSKLVLTLVKEYSRPAAGKVVRARDLRNLATLKHTVDYLMSEVYMREDVSYLTRYEFIFDRVRAIRQDVTIQRLCADNPSAASKLYESILAFYLLADYKLCDCKDYDAYINSQHVNEVLQAIVSNVEHSSSTSLYLAVFMLVNMNNTQALVNTLKSAKHHRGEEPLGKCLALLDAYLCNNYVRLFGIYKQLPLLCQLAFHRHIVPLEIKMLKVMNAAYSSRSLTYPCDHLLRITLLGAAAGEAKGDLIQKYIDAKLIRMLGASQSDPSQTASRGGDALKALLPPSSTEILFSKPTPSTTTTTSVDVSVKRDRLAAVDSKLANDVANESRFLLDSTQHM